MNRFRRMAKSMDLTIVRSETAPYTNVYKAYGLLPHQSSLSNWIRLQNLAVVDHDALNGLWCVSRLFLLHVRRDFRVYLSKKGVLELSKRLGSYVTLSIRNTR